MSTTNEWRVPTPDSAESNVYYGLWDLLSDEAKQTPAAKGAQADFGVNTSNAILLLFRLYQNELENFKSGVNALGTNRRDAVYNADGTINKTIHVVAEWRMINGKEVKSYTAVRRSERIVVGCETEAEAWKLARDLVSMESESN